MIVIYFAVWILVKLYIQDFLVDIANEVIWFFGLNGFDLIAQILLTAGKILLNEFVLAFIIALPVALFLKNRGAQL